MFVLELLLNYWFSFTLAYSRISHEYSSLVIKVINLIFMFSLWCIDWVRRLYANRVFMYFCIKSCIGTQVKLACCKSALTPPPLPPTTLTPVVYSTGRSKAVVPVLVFLSFFFFTRGDLFYVLPCVSYFILVFFSPFSIAVTSLGEERANLSAFRNFVWFVLVWFCRFPLPLDVWEGLRFVIVAFPGRFSYLFFTCPNQSTKS